jgi:hypothetical protein
MTAEQSKRYLIARMQGNRILPASIKMPPPTGRS